MPSTLLCTAKVDAAEHPNVVIMLADDMGFGELQCLNPERGKIPTPQLDRIAASGMVFSDAHSGSSVCTPTRYGLLTGRYAWRTRLQSGVLTGGQSLIAEDRCTIAKLLTDAGYDTAVIGKWHLGMLFDGEHQTKDVEVGVKVTHGPIDRGGFQTFHGFHHARQIKTWIDGSVVTENIQPVEMLPRLTEAAVSFIESRNAESKPFLLYVPWSSPHSPVVPSKKWAGKSGLNEHADFVMQSDDSFGQVIDALERTGLRQNTLIICSSDNGTSAPTSKMSELQSKGHFSSGDLRGSKADIWDGGHRVPFIVSWPEHVQAGSSCDQLVGLQDVLATLAEMINVPVPSGCGEDSVSFYSLLKGDRSPTRTSLVHHSVSGYFAIRQGDWKLSLCPDSGGWTGKRPSKKTWRSYQEQGLPMVQLVNIAKDLGEQQNLANEYPEKVVALKNKLTQIVNEHPNDTQITIEKSPRK
ncbi:arylsulfatase [Stieleria sp. JC731]|uniref:sulfatase family protein n=1 Tax=Pirellulaceae TaxID=2691357 RepID=UPI001E59CE1E|nr:arylsulfatase [Stieleria sp. JC731]MCC9602660.1 arylsulfatase [Stieleria sp. JC731]